MGKDVNMFTIELILDSYANGPFVPTPSGCRHTALSSVSRIAAIHSRQTIILKIKNSNFSVLWRLSTDCGR
jgi:hypothetical protein